MKRILFATANAHKLFELRGMLPDHEVAGLADIGCRDDIPETADTFAGNALQKAQWVMDRYPDVDTVAADDSGLEVDALGGEPGVRSARYAGEGHDSRANNALLIERLRGVDDRRARFRTVVALLRRGEEPLFFEGTVEGTITRDPRGTNGFGYDPYFVPDGFSRTFAELAPEEKNAVSHRGRAVAALCDFLNRS